MADTQPLAQDSSTLGDSLGFDINKLPGFLKQEATAKKAASTADIQAKALEESVGLEEKRKALENISAEDKAHYEDVKKQMMPEPQFKPTKDNAADIGGLFSMIATMGVALGGSGKLSGLNAMNAMGGMLKGYQQGRKDLFTKEQATFDKELASMKAHNDELIKDLEQYNKLRVTDKEAALIKAGEITAKYPGVIAAKINAGDTKVAADIAHSNSEMLMKMAEARTRLGLAGKGGASDQAQLIREFTGASLDKKAVPEVANLAKSIGQADDLAQFARQNADLIGRSGQINQQIERYIDSWKQGIEPDDKGQPALVFAKKYAAYLVSYEKALAGGARGFTVQFQKRFNDLLKQDQFNVAGFLQLMDQQISELSAQATPYSKNITRENMTALGRNIIQRSESANPASVKNYATEEEAEKAEKEGKLHRGDRVVINGQSGTWQ